MTVLSYDMKDVNAILEYAYRRENWRTPGDGHNPGDIKEHCMLVGPIEVVFSIMLFSEEPHRVIIFRVEGRSEPPFNLCVPIAQSFGFKGELETWILCQDSRRSEAKGFAQPFGKRKKAG